MEVIKMKKLLCIACLLLLAGCQAPLVVIPARQQQVETITLGSVQKYLKKGEPSGVVVQYLGTPNIVTSNADGTESWIYDKISTEIEYASGLSSGVATKSSRTMIVVVKFDSLKRIEDVKYRQTSY
jgi:outer membrane protein assembly factor BamE (lipoprotein component of BamABCDE complex)